MTDYVLCISNATNPASLMLGKVYRRLPDAEAEGHQMTSCSRSRTGQNQAATFTLSHTLLRLSFPRRQKTFCGTAGERQG